MGIPRAGGVALIVATLGSATVVHADSNGWGFVPGARIGAVHGSFDGSETMPGAQAGWGYTTELHVDALRTFAGDRAALGLSLGYLSQTHGTISDDAAVPSATGAFKHSGAGLSLMLTTMVGGRNSMTARAGWVAGETQTAAGPIDAALRRFGLELTRIWATHTLHLAGHVAVEYFTSSDDSRGYDAISIVVGGTFVFHEYR